MPPPADASQKTSPLSPCFLSNPPLLPSVLRDCRPRDRRPLLFSSKEEKEPKVDKREREKQSLCHLPLKKQPPVPLFKQIMPALYLLFESASGYALLEAHGLDAIGGSTPAVQESVTDLDRFGKVRKNSLGIRRPSVDERDREREREGGGERDAAVKFDALCCYPWRWFVFSPANAASLARDGHHYSLLFCHEKRTKMTFRRLRGIGFQENQHV